MPFDEQGNFTLEQSNESYGINLNIPQNVQEEVSPENALARLMMQQYKEYAPQVSSQYWQQYQQTPSWIDMLRRNQNSALQRSGQNTLGSLYAGAAGRGMANSGQFQNMAATLGAEQMRQSSANEAQLGQLGDQRQFNLLSALGNFTIGQGNQSTDIYGNLENRRMQQKQIDAQGDSALWSALGMVGGAILGGPIGAAIGGGVGSQVR